jgi:hypothetical protein
MCINREKTLLTYRGWCGWIRILVRGMERVKSFDKATSLSRSTAINLELCELKFLFLAPTGTANIDSGFKRGTYHE